MRALAYSRCRRLAFPVAALLSVFLFGGCEKKIAITIQGKGAVAEAGGAFTCNAPCEQSGKGELTLTATPDEGSTFTNWGGDCTGDKPICNLTVEDNVNVLATFAKKRVLKVIVKGNGRVTTADGKINCPEDCGTVLRDVQRTTLRATPSDGAVFGSFSGDCEGRVCELVMDKGKTVTATFIRPPGSVLPPIEGGLVNQKLRAQFAISENGDVVMASVTNKTLHLVRKTMDGKDVFAEEHPIKDVTALPAVAFFGDDIVISLGGKKSTTIMRITPDGKTPRYSSTLKGCPGLTQLSIVADSAFLAGTFSGSSVCGEARLLAAGKTDIAVTRVALEDGSLTWAAQLGSAGEDELVDFGISRVEETFVAYNGKKGARINRLNPAGKTFPVESIGREQSNAVTLLAMTVAPDGAISAAANIDSTVDFGGGKLGVTGGDGDPRLVLLRYGEDMRHVSSKLISRSSCGPLGLCRFDPRGGFVRLPKKTSGGLEVDADPVTVSAAISRTGTDGTERWGKRIKKEGGVAVLDAHWHKTKLLVLVAFHGDLEVGGTPLKSNVPRVATLTFLDD